MLGGSKALTEWIFIPVSIVGACCFAVLFRTPKRYFLLTIVVGFMAGVLRSLKPEAFHVGFWTFGVALTVACLSHAFARWKRVPAQCFLIPGIIVLVPGSYIYRAFSKALEQDLKSAATLTLAGITIACGITFGVLLANLMVPSKRSL